MTTRKKPAEVVDLKAVETTVSKPSAPLILESSTQYMAWQRDLAALNGEIEVLNAQQESARRIHAVTLEQAQAVFDAKVYQADQEQAAARLDADKVLAATAEMVNRRRADLEKVLDGHLAALGALQREAAE